MRYTEVIFRYSFQEECHEDLFVQGLADIGFETFMDESAYIQTALLDEKKLREYVQAFCETFGGQTAVEQIEDCPDEDWNATWEEEHPEETLPLGIRIIPHCAFGAGHHETTGMMITALLEAAELSAETEALPGGYHADDFSFKHVLDQGCGTGVLGIFAKKLGAQTVTAVDIDDKSVENTRENAALNGSCIDARLGNEVPEGQYDLILANIHRNILLQMMPAFGRCCKAGGEVWLSGFYEEDIEPLVAAAKEQGFALKTKRETGEWRMIQLVHTLSATPNHPLITH